MVPLFYESYALGSYQARSWARQALNEGHSAVLFMPDCSALASGLGWGELELSLSTKTTGIQDLTGNKAKRSMQIVAVVRREPCVLVHSSTDKIWTEIFFKRIQEENLYYTHKQYSVFFKIRKLSKVNLGKTGGMASACIPDGDRAGSIYPETFGHWCLCSTEVLCSWCKFLIGCSCQRLAKSALNQGLNPDLLSLAYSLTAKPVRYILKPLL